MQERTFEGSWPMSATRQDEFVDAVYDAVLDPRGLSVFTDMVRESLNGSSAVLQMVAGKESYSIAATSNVPEWVARLYLDYYHKVNPFFPVPFERFGDGATALVSDFISLPAYYNCEFFTDFAKPTGAVYILGGFIGLGASCRAMPAIHRPMEDPEFTDADRTQLKKFLAPAAGALRLRERLGPALGAGLAALQTVAFGAVVCDGGRRLVFVNQAAERLAAGGHGINLGWRAGGISASLPYEQRRLAQLIKDAAGSGRAGAMAVTGSTGKKLFLLVTPLPRMFNQAARLVLVTLRAAEASPLVDAGTLISVFGLTPAEARVAVALSTGASIGEITVELGVKEPTVRTHISRLLDKSGAANQREFVALLALLPPVKPA
jgi:DNA-binding CsgD family transcriptional regulator